MSNRELFLAILAGLALFALVRVVALGGPTPEETLANIRCAEKARVLAETDGPFVFVPCDGHDMGVTP